MMTIRLIMLTVFSSACLIVFTQDRADADTASVASVRDMALIAVEPAAGRSSATFTEEVMK